MMRLSPAFRCRLCWLVTLAVFVGILVIEAIILVPSYRNYERDRLESIEHAGHQAMLVALAANEGNADSEALERLLEGSVVRALLPAGEAHADAASTTRAAGSDSLRASRRYGSTDHMWVTSAPDQLPIDGTLYANLDTSSVGDQLQAFVVRIIGLVLLIAVFVTAVTMPVLQLLVLGPLIALRDRMCAAGAEPERASAFVFGSQRRDEFGDVARAFDSMLMLNDEHRRAIAEREARYRALNAELDQRVAERTRELEQANRALAYRASHDDLTGLYNRTTFTEELNRTLADEENQQIGILLLGIDSFGSINGVYGYQTGDRVLQVLAHQLQETLPQNHVVARFGGDVFAILAPARDNADVGQLAALATDVQHTIEAPIVVGNRRLQSRVGVGYTWTDDHTTTPESLLGQADLALIAAKRGGGPRIRAFMADMDAAMEQRLRYSAGIRHGLQHDEFFLDYQAQCDTDGVVFGCEALVRWHSAEFGLVSPADFIPVAEETGLIRDLGVRVLDMAVRQIARWRQQGRHLTLAVNLSPLQLESDNLVAHIEALLLAHAVPADALELEITESAIVGDHEHHAATLQRLAELGIQLAIDDFGTGYSSLAYLARLPVHRLKIDRAFVQALPDDSRNATICRTIIELGRMLDLTVLAEGIESREQADWLKVNGCQEFQGFLFGRPQPADRLTRELPRNNEARAVTAAPREPGSSPA